MSVMSQDKPHALHQTVPVYHAHSFRVRDGVAEGDAISFADELVLDDVYELDAKAHRSPITLSHLTDGTGFEVSGGTLGTVGNRIALDCVLMLMAPDSTTLEALVMVELQDGGVEAIYLLPLATLMPKTDYRLVGVDRDKAAMRFAEVACVSFTRGTHITMASGEQRPIEDLVVGDRVLTRDDGPQAVRWIGQTTLRAVGDFAPVVIKQGTLHNAHDLVVSPDHRLFVYQRVDHLGAGRSEVLVKVRHLINGDTVYQQGGGFVDYFQLLFDDHQLIFAEGIAAESLMIDPRTRPAMPSAVLQTDHSHRHHHDYEIKEGLLTQGDTAGILRKASSS